MDGSLTTLWRVVFSLAITLFVPGVQGQEFDTDRPNQNISPGGLALPQADYRLCKKACDDMPQCKAYTYVKPGRQGPQARCWLKYGVPSPVKNDCCISGVKPTPHVTATPDGCIDWKHPPAGIVFALKHSKNQSDKRFASQGNLYDPASAQIPPVAFTRQDGGDLNGSRGEGYYWFETTGIGFQFPVGVPDAVSAAAWKSFLGKLPAGLVVGLKHSVNQKSKAFVWLSGGGDPEFPNFQTFSYDPVDANSDIPYPFERQNGGDRHGSTGEGYYWYEVKVGASGCDDPALMPGGLVFGLKHSMNQPNKNFVWHGVTYDARGGPVPPGFVRCHGGDLGAPAGQGYYWFETASGQSQLGRSCSP